MQFIINYIKYFLLVLTYDKMVDIIRRSVHDVNDTLYSDFGSKIAAFVVLSFLPFGLYHKMFIM